MNTTRAHNDLQVNEDEDSSQIEVIVPSRNALDYDPPIQTNDQVENNIDWNMVEHNREGDEENQDLSYSEEVEADPRY